MFLAEKTVKDRLAEAMKHYENMIFYGFELHRLEKFRAVMNGWVKTGTFFEGRVELEDYNKVMLMQLFNVKGMENIIVIRKQ